ncbi:hypothetical protein CSW25_03740 [Thermus scotoductus]|uniref:Uncharacterized protein n=2 Tax=Thermus TaxID=270 RepID=A0A430RVU5_THESC|nr:hypothetical protein [Thermus scotoductus]AYJ74831.1 hypothetical protein phiMa_48 [Thermus phage phiMa]RTG97062.1 hypothetical protein CSW49_03730 [Thermus scotoductus]RTH05499.1 hypothetical protein CSW45_03275 [Thermus scotoductus]RTH12441.1 hypothetical protein CSW46_02085 [Thermus scotoductus]RTH12883.1 hypothetical protein CSW44_03095 [Thermus scotoductus]
MGKKAEPTTPPARPMSLEEWARNAGLSVVALRAMQLRYRDDRATADEWMQRYTRMMAETAREWRGGW